MQIKAISFSERGYRLARRLSEAIKKNADPFQLELVYKGRETLTDFRAGSRSEIATINREPKPLSDIVRESFENKIGLLFIGAAGIAVRSIAPFVNDKLYDPPVLVMDEWGEHVIPILSGHVGGANRLAQEIADALAAVPVITTASELNKKRTGSDVQEYVLGIGCKKGTSASVIENVVSKALLKAGICAEDTGISESGTGPQERENESLFRQISAVATIDKKRCERGLLDFVESHYLTLVTYSAEELNGLEGEFSASDFVKETVGVDNVCERAAMKAAGSGSELIMHKTAAEGVTVALAGRSPIERTPAALGSLAAGRSSIEDSTSSNGRPKIYVVGMGPGGADKMTLEARRAISEADVIVGYSTYIKLLEKYSSELIQGKRIRTTPMRKERERCQICIEEAQAGNTVAFVCSGDAGVYGMASPMLKMLDMPPHIRAEEMPPHIRSAVSRSSSERSDVSVEIVAGVTAANSGAALLGAPLANDYCVISLSDLLTPRDQIEHRIRAALEGDFVLAIYNPASTKRKEFWQKICGIISEYRDDDTPCGMVRNIGRDDTASSVFTVGELREIMPDMLCTVYIGNSQTKIVGRCLVTDRGY